MNYRSELVVGETRDRYKILERLGAGGMGEVYVAQDSKLGRKVAIKLLHSDFTIDDERVRRFQQEARVTSGLNHPNILTIYEIRQIDNGHCIVTEFIEGETLRKRMAGKRMELAAALDIAIQVASALRAAHDAGIVHRDIKPENIMVRPDDLVKVLDFGLAKLTQLPSATIDSKAPTDVVTDTTPGMVMGTPHYMSPEQARGLKVDARTDIFSLGVVLYEMLAGHAPFEGETPSDIIVSILEKDPSPLARFSPETPEAMQRIINRSLCKKREERYQTANELLTDLRALRQEIEFEAKLKRPHPSRSNHQESVGTSGDRLLNEKSRESKVKTEKARGGPLQISNHASGSPVTFARRLRQSAPASVLVILLLVAGIGLYLLPKGEKPVGDAIQSIAVLPLVNGRADPNVEYLCDGITESIINSLSQLPKLKVLARSTVFRYKGLQDDPIRVGRDLGVGAVLTGRVIQQGDNLAIQVDLVNVADGTQLWGEKYDRKLSDIFAVQEEIATHISERLRLRLTGEGQKRLAKRYTGNADAYQAYLLGRYFWNKRNEDGMKKGIQYFQQAIDIDPAYALAYGGLADCYLLLFGYSFLPPKECAPKARAAATKALEIDESLAEAHASLGYLMFSYDWDWSGAEREFRRAIELNPNYATAHHWYGFYLALMGRFDEGLTAMKRAQEIDPGSLIISTNIGRLHYLARRYDLAIEQLKSTLEMDANFSSASEKLAEAYEAKQMYGEAIVEYQKWAKLDGNDELASKLGQAYAISGFKGAIRKWIDHIGTTREQDYTQLGILYSALGDKDRAFFWLEKAYEARSPWLDHLMVGPMFDNLRADPRFRDLERRIGFPGS